jgi:hypothetical protein
MANPLWFIPELEIRTKLREVEHAKLFFYGTFLKSHMVYGLSMEIHVSISL